MNHPRRADAEFPIQEVLRSRYSPYVFEDRDIPLSDLRSIFEAARWAPSSFNEQPWRYIVAPKTSPDDFALLLSCLTESNQKWAKWAAVLGLAVTRTLYSLNAKPNRVALHDLGLATALLTFEAMSRGVYVHPMGGILPDRAREVYGVPPEFDVITGLALGYQVPPDRVPEEWKARELGPIKRRPQAETVFAQRWGQYGLQEPA